MQGPLDAAQPSLSGEMHPINPAVPSQLFSSSSPPIDSRVSDKLKAKIWNNEYFELRALLTNTVHESRYQVTLARTTAEQLPSLYLEPVAKPRKIFTIETWLSCFHIFIAIYTRRHPHEAPPLMKYCGVIQDLAASGFNWCFYDENYCLLHQAQPSSFRWCNIHWELWMCAQHSTASKPQTLPGCLRSHEQGIPKGFCVKFHRGVQCVPGCAFKHLCYKFEGPQKASQCNFRSQSKNTGKQSFLPSPNPQSLNLPTPINAERLVFLLSGYDPSIVEFLFIGFSEGFAIHYDGSRESSDAKNFILALENPDVVEIEKDLDAGRLAGPFIAHPFHPFCISPQGVVPKKTPGDFRHTHNISNPKDFSVNESISSDHSSVCYATTQDAINHIKTFGPGCFLAKTDIKNAFQIIPVCPQDYNLLGTRWHEAYFYDCYMPTGRSSSCETFETFSTTLEWIASSQLSISHIIHLLDDFLIYCPLLVPYAKIN